MTPSRPNRNEKGGILVKLIVLLFLGIFFLALYFVRHPIFRFMAESWVSRILSKNRML